MRGDWTQYRTSLEGAKLSPDPAGVCSRAGCTAFSRRASELAEPPVCDLGEKNTFSQAPIGKCQFLQPDFFQDSQEDEASHGQDVGSPGTHSWHGKAFLVRKTDQCPIQILEISEIHGENFILFQLAAELLH